MNKILEEFEVVLFTSKTELDLCHKCRKDFERFMRNENINTRNSAKNG